MPSMYCFAPGSIATPLSSTSPADPLGSVHPPLARSLIHCIPIHSMASWFLSTTTSMSPPRRRRSPRPVLLEEKDPDWSTLPEELLERIGRMLPSRRHALQFRSICPAWRAGLPFARYVGPLLMLPYNRDCAVTFYTVADGGETTFTRNLPSLRGKVLRGSSRGWLALVDDEAASLTLLNPLTDTTVELPPADEQVVVASFSQAKMLDGIETVILLADGNVIKLDELKKSTMFRQKKMSAVFSQIVISSSSPGSGNCVAMAALQGTSTVAFCRVGVDVAWSLLDTDLDCVTLVVHFHGSRFLAIDDECSGRYNVCDVAGAAPRATSVPLSLAPVNPCHYMVVNGELYIVGTILQGSTYLGQVYKSNVLAAKPSWTRVGNASDLTLLMSSNFTAGYGGAVSVSSFRKNSAYCLAFNSDRDQFEWEIIDIPNGTSEFQSCPKKILGSGAFCWIQPNYWT